MKNYFGKKIYSPNEILIDPELDAILQSSFTSLLDEYVPDPKIKKSFLNKIWGAKDEADLNRFEACVKELFNSIITNEKKISSYEKRAMIICNQIKNYIIGGEIADFGCGDGLVSYFSNNLYFPKYKFDLYDIQNYLDARVKLIFNNIVERKELDTIDKYDTVLVLTVLHHANDPINVLKNVINICKKRIIIIESVYGLTSFDHNIYSPLYGLDINLQIKYAIFWDWFYNRVIHDNVSVPYNFQTPQNWEEVFKKYNLDIIHKENLGVDQKIVPEHHYLFVLDKQ